MHTSDLPTLLNIHTLAARVLGSHKKWSFLDDIKVVNSGEKFGAARYSSAFDAPAVPLPISHATALALAVDAKSQTLTVQSRVHAALSHLPPQQNAAISALQQAFKADQSASRVSADILKPADVKSRMATATSDFSSFSPPPQSEPAAKPVDAGKDEKDILDALQQSKQLYEQEQALIATHATAVRDTAAVWGYAVHSIEPNGHCGPNTIVHQVSIRKDLAERTGGTLRSAEDVRKLIAGELLGTRNTLYWELTSDQWGRLAFAREVSAWQSSGSWKSEVMNLFLLAAANALSVAVLLVRSVPVHIMLVLPTTGPPRDVIAIGHLLIDNKEHFDSLVPSDFTSERQLVELLAHSVLLLRCCELIRFADVAIGQATTERCP